ncbi:MAG TPA: hypothetical protein VIV12_16950 [Streptosporangiaceae bacterium]
MGTEFGTEASGQEADGSGAGAGSSPGDRGFTSPAASQPHTDPAAAARMFDAATTRRRSVVFEEDDDLDVPDFLK